MKDEENAKATAGGKLKAAGVEFGIAELNGKAIRIYTDQKLSIDEIKLVAKELFSVYDIIQFSQYPKTNRGEEYCTYQYKMILDNDNNNVISFDPSK